MLEIGASVLSALLLVLSVGSVTSANARQPPSPHLTDVDLVTDPCGFVFFNGKYHLFYEFFQLGNSTRTPTGNETGFLFLSSVLLKS